MSTCITKDISCPNCGAVHRTQMWPGIDRLAHPELRARIMEETFFDWKCPRCGYTAQMTYPCLYHDRELGVMICLAPGRTRFTLEIPKYLDKVVKRAVSTLPQLKEKILLFESGMDDIRHGAGEKSPLRGGAAKVADSRSDSLFLLLQQKAD